MWDATFYMDIYLNSFMYVKNDLLGNYNLQFIFHTDLWFPTDVCNFFYFGEGFSILCKENK